MTKEEKIKEAWGEYWGLFNYNTQKRILESNGSVDYFLLSKEEKEDTEVLIGDIRKLECTKTDEGTARYFRPKSLKGIENNNGWNKIESEDDLPTDTEVKYWGANQNGVFEGIIFPFESISIKYKNKTLTHYQPIQEPKPPLY
jgi:hypothetical protein